MKLLFCCCASSRTLCRFITVSLLSRSFLNHSFVIISEEVFNLYPCERVHIFIILLMKASAAVVLCLALTSIALGFDFTQFQITKVDRTVQLNGVYPSETNKIQYSCKINTCDDYFYYSILEQFNNKISTITFAKDRQVKEVYTYTTSNYNYNGRNFVLYRVEIKARLQAKETVNVAVSIVYLNRYVNYPTSIDMTEDQKFEYLDGKRFVSPYLTRSDTVTYKFAKLLGFEGDGEKKGLGSVSFKAADVEPFTVVEHRVHGVNNEPQVVFSQVIREIEVSHWGNVAITEFYKIKNIGPELKGEFSRVQFSSNNKFEAKNTWRGIQTTLPYQIWGLYYRDEVGNISTSRAYRDNHNQVVKLGLAPRYGLLGGWKANWEIGYNLNTKGFLSHENEKFQLNRVPIQYALSTVLAEKYTVRVVLPEGVTDVKLFVGGKPVDMQKVTKGISFRYLDFTGRPTLTVEDLEGSFKGQNLKVTYSYDQKLMLKKPLIVFGAFFSILILIVIVKRINMSAFEDAHVKKTQ